MVTLAYAMTALLTAAAAIWCALALFYTAPGPPIVGYGLAALALLVPLGVAMAQHSIWHGAAAAGIVLAAVLAWYLSLTPPQDADWQSNVANLAHAELDGHRVTVHNVRNFDYRTETDYTPRWETRTYDISKLAGLDVFFSHWAGPAIAHTILSWSFSDGQHLAISIETRNRVGQRYSAIAGFFRQYPIYYVVADERDVIRLRTNYRGEHVWLYRLRTDDNTALALLFEYLGTINVLAASPDWYNALTANCTTTIRQHVRHFSPSGSPWSWRLLLNGYLPELLYDEGRLDRSLEFAELQAVSNIDARAVGASYSEFSDAIRVGLPNPRREKRLTTRGLTIVELRTDDGGISSSM